MALRCRAEGRFRPLNGPVAGHISRWLFRDDKSEVFLCEPGDLTVAVPRSGGVFSAVVTLPRRVLFLMPRDAVARVFLPRHRSNRSHPSPDLRSLVYLFDRGRGYAAVVRPVCVAGSLRSFVLACRCLCSGRGTRRRLSRLSLRLPCRVRLHPCASAAFTSPWSAPTLATAAASPCWRSTWRSCPRRRWALLLRSYPRGREAEWRTCCC